MKQKILILILLSFTSLSLFFLWWNQAIKPFDSSNKKTVNFTISSGEEIKSIAERLKKEKLIRSPLAFFLFVRLKNIAPKIQAGNFYLSPSMDLPTLTQTLTHGREDIWITIPEGWRKEEIALKLHQELGIPKEEFLNLAKEGYMFPDTYLFPKKISAFEAVNIFLTNFNRRVNEELRKKAEEKGLNFTEWIIIASLVEREAKFKEDKPLVASVILNRLKIGMKLDIDATIQYALGYQANEKSWWKKELSREDLEIISPYNTYKISGLPPGPIANPGLVSLMAVLEAPKTDYLYYISDKTGKIHLAKNIQEHNLNIAKYLQ